MHHLADSAKVVIGLESGARPVGGTVLSLEARRGAVDAHTLSSGAAAALLVLVFLGWDAGHTAYFSAND